MKLVAGAQAGRPLAFLVASCLSLSASASMAAECGSSGNTFWTFNGAAPLEHAVVGDLGIYVVAGTKLSLVDPATGAEINSRDFITVTLGRPIVFTLRNPVNGAGREVVVAGSDGIVYGLHPSTLANNWTRSTRRSTCTADAITAPPVVQLWESSDASFRAARSTDVVMVGTHYACGTTTANKVYGLNAETGAVLWIFNSSGTTYSVDAVSGLAVDYARNMVYVTSDKPDPFISQVTAWSLSTTTGTRLWYQDFGAILTEPVFVAGRLYVTTRAGTLASLDPTTGTALWGDVVTSGGTQITTRLVADASSLSDVALYIVDTSGLLHAYLDRCVTRTPLWSYKPASASFCAPPAVLPASGTIYVGADDGRVYQLWANNGSGQAYATISAGSASYGSQVVIEDTGGGRPRLLARAGTSLKKLCIPWIDTPGDRAFRLGLPGFDLDAPSGLMGVRIFIPSFNRDRRAPSRPGRSRS